MPKCGSFYTAGIGLGRQRSPVREQVARSVTVGSVPVQAERFGSLEARLKEKGGRGPASNF